MAVPTFKKANEELANTIVESDSNIFEYKPQQPCKYVFKPPLDVKIDIERASAHIGVVTRTYVEAIGENCPAKWTSTIQSQPVMAFRDRLEDVLQARCFHSNNVLKSDMFNVVEQALSEVIQFGRAATSSEPKMLPRIPENAVPDTIVNSVLSNTGFILSIAETEGKMMYTAVDENCLRDREHASSKVAV